MNERTGQRKKENWNLLGISSMPGSGAGQGCREVEKLGRCTGGFAKSPELSVPAARTVAGHLWEL